MKQKLHSQELYSYPNHNNRIGELDGQLIHEHYHPNGLTSEWSATVGTWGQQNYTLSSLDTPNTNCEPFEMDSCMDRFEKDGDMISELPTDGYQNIGNTSYPQSSQLNEQSDQSGSALPQGIDDLIQEAAFWQRNFPFPEPAGQSQIDGRNPAAGIVDQQAVQIIGNTSFPESSQLNEPSDQSGSALPQGTDDWIQEADAFLRSNFAFPEPAGQSQIDGRHPAAGIVDQQAVPFADLRGLRPTYSDYYPPLTPNRAEVQRSCYPRASPDHVYPLRHTQIRAHGAIGPTINTINFHARGQNVRHSQPNPATGHSPYTNRPVFQNSGHPQASPNHVPRSTMSAYGLPSTQTLPHSSSKLTINTTNVPAGGQKIRRGHPIPETGPVNSPPSTSSNQTNATWSNDSMGTVVTPVTSVSDSDSPTGLSPLSVPYSAQPSGNPQQNGFTCRTCRIPFTDRSNLRRHEKHTHGEVDRTPCRAGCGRDFARRDNEGRHYAKQCKIERSGSDKKRRKAGFFGVHLAYSQK